MAGNVLSRGELFPEELIEGLFSKVTGKSSLAKLSGQIPIAFNGNEFFTFTMDDEVNIVGENEVKPAGKISIAPRTYRPLKMEYGARVSDEFLYGSEEVGINILKAFAEGYAKKLAKGLDLAALHGINPRTGTKSTIIGSNNFADQVTQTVEFNMAEPDDNIQTAVDLIQGSEREVNGLILAPAFASALANYKVNGISQFPEFRWGRVPEATNGLRVDVNSTVSANQAKERAIIGDFANLFKWGYAKQIPMEVIPYGDPDQSGQDLKAHNQVYIRCETYIGWALMDPESFARIVEAGGEG
ncbi:MAG: phage major capsid protein [Eubacteriales bacterium]|nr:phage major capsid protein [Eubacteriales bacterium]